MNKTKEQFERFMKIIELEKTPERKQFEQEYSCYIFSLRPSTVEPDTPQVKWCIDTWYKVEKGKWDEVSRISEMIKMRARFNMATVYGVWLPNLFNDDKSHQIDDPDKYYDLIFKYKFKI